MDEWTGGGSSREVLCQVTVLCVRKQSQQAIRLCISGVRKLLRSPGIVKCQVKCYFHVEHSSVLELMSLV